MALASSGSTQSTAPPDDALSPMEILSSPLTQPQAAGAKSDASKETDAAKKADANKKADATKKADASKKTDATKKGNGSKSADSEADYLGQCLRDWDAGTHMTRRQWARTCRRVAANRLRYQRAFQEK